jgi:hypothetical protein
MTVLLITLILTTYTYRKEPS